MNDAKRLDPLAIIILFTVTSPETFSQVARNAELYGSKFYQAQQYPSILVTHLSCFFCLIEDLKNELYYSFIALVSLFIKG